jgi:polyribonucleotide nucleotidyltransferase
MIKSFKTEIAGRTLEVEVGRVAEQANGAAWLKYGDTVVLVTACTSKSSREGIDFFPLSVEYQEKLYAVGKIPGGFIKRESRPSEKAILTDRLIDRPIRPLFPDGFRNEVQVVATLLSVDQDCAPDIVAMIGSSIALSISDIPFEGPTASVMVGLIDDELIINPTSEQTEKSDLHLVVSGTEEAIMMVEAGANEVSEEKVLEAILYGHDEIKKLVRFINEIVAEVGKEKMVIKLFKPDEEIKKEIFEFGFDKLKDSVKTVDKQERKEKMDEVQAAVFDEFIEKYPENKNDINSIIKSMMKKVVRGMISKDKIRPDNRALTEVREITCNVGLLPRTHGSGLFTRGQTQALTITTLGSLRDAQRLDGIGLEDTKRYMHHYNFPPFSVGEAGFMRGPNRRAIGHGALAERALLPVIPSAEEFPYSIRVVSEVLSSNGSSSQASVCGSTLSLLDAGVPLKKPVAGIAMGLIKEGDDISILTDIQGLEDFLGDMDFKVAGTKDGITAIQMDIKIHGINREILATALKQAKDGRLFIMNEMNAIISEPRVEMSAYAPRVFSMMVDPEKIRDIIGPGGKVINRIIAETGAKVDIDDTGRVLITANDEASGKQALKSVENIVKDVEVGEIYNGKIVKIMPFGAFVQLIPGKDGLCHISQLTAERLEKVEDKFSVGDEIKVIVKEIDKMGRINLSRKALLEKNDKNKKS